MQHLEPSLIGHWPSRTHSTAVAPRHPWMCTDPLSDYLSVAPSQPGLGCHRLLLQLCNHRRWKVFHVLTDQGAYIRARCLQRTQTARQASRLNFLIAQHSCEYAVGSNLEDYCAPGVALPSRYLIPKNLPEIPDQFTTTHHAKEILPTCRVDDLRESVDNRG